MSALSGCTGYGNDYLITVKGNQPTLCEQLETQFEQLPLLSVDHQDVVGFAQQIRAPWHIENWLHWFKGVVLKEDETPLCDGSARLYFSDCPQFRTQSLSA